LKSHAFKRGRSVGGGKRNFKGCLQQSKIEPGFKQVSKKVEVKNCWLATELVLVRRWVDGWMDGWLGGWVLNLV
jgi:hypothetical protein